MAVSAHVLGVVHFCGLLLSLKTSQTSSADAAAAAMPPSAALTPSAPGSEPAAAAASVGAAAPIATFTQSEGSDATAVAGK